MIPVVASQLVDAKNAGGTATFRGFLDQGTYPIIGNLSPNPPAWLTVTLMIIASVYSLRTSKQPEGYAEAVIWIIITRVCFQYQTRRVNF